MGKYVFVYSGGSRPPNEADAKKMMDAWTAYFGKIGPHIVDGGAPFMTPGKLLGAKTGPSHATGYSIVSADSMDAAVALTKDHPHLAYGGGIEVFETMKM